ncbi:unnamed protein product, partial [Rotaria magnacalcarata]
NDRYKTFYFINSVPEK